jgi:hypothetical protein
VPPTPVRLERHTLERGRRNPQRGTDTCSALARGHAVTSGASPPSPSALCGHPSHCSAIPDAVETRGDRTSPRPLLCPVRPLASGTLESARTATEQATPTPPPSKSLLDEHRARHDVPPEAGFARTAVYSAALYATPPHIDKTVRHACKLPPSWPIKGGAAPWP